MIIPIIPSKTIQISKSTIPRRALLISVCEAVVLIKFTHKLPTADGLNHCRSLFILVNIKLIILSAPKYNNPRPALTDELKYALNTKTNARVTVTCNDNKIAERITASMGSGSY